MGVADEVWMLENAVYSVVSPEGCASILWKDSSKAAEAAERLKITSQDLYKMHVIERIIREPKNLDDRLFDSLRNSIYQLFQQKLAMPVEELLNERYDRFRRMGNPEAQEEPVGQ